MPLINRCGGGGGTPQLCGQVENFKVIPGTLSATLKWTAPSPDEDNSFVGARIVRKTGSAPTGLSDGTVVYEGTALTYADTGLTAGTTYYYRAFAYNARKKYQTEYRVVSLTALSAVTLSACSWQQISTVSASGMAANLWSVGDTKSIILNGTVKGVDAVDNGVTFNNFSVEVFIIGINHNAAREGNNLIHFQIGKSQNKLISFGDSAAYSLTGRVKTFCMNPANTHVGGWRNSYMRSVLGNSEVNYNQTAPFISVLPQNLKSVMKTAYKYTDNTGAGVGEDPAQISASADLITLASPFEYAGAYTGVSANTAENEYQEQYAYYKAGNSRVHYDQNDLTSAQGVWCRSPTNNGAATSNKWGWMAISKAGDVTYYGSGTSKTVYSYISPIIFV